MNYGTIQRLEYDTQAVEEYQRFDYWHDVVCQQFVTADSQCTNRKSFDAELISKELGALTINSMTAPQHFWKRTGRHVKSDGEDCYLLSILQQGSGLLSQGGVSVRQYAGDIVLYDTAKPFAYELNGSVRLIKIPRANIEPRVNRLYNYLATNLTTNNNLTSLLVDTLDLAMNLDDQVSNSDIFNQRISDSVIDLFLANLDMLRNQKGDEHKVANRIEKAKQYALDHLSDNELNAEKMAIAASVSTRTLNRMFGQLGLTPMKWVMQERLKLGMRYLQDHKDISVTETAFICGFSDLSHFSRSFKRQFGITPLQSVANK